MQDWPKSPKETWGKRLKCTGKVDHMTAKYVVEYVFAQLNTHNESVSMSTAEIVSTYVPHLVSALRLEVLPFITLSSVEFELDLT